MHRRISGVFCLHFATRLRREKNMVSQCCDERFSFTGANKYVRIMSTLRLLGLCRPLPQLIQKKPTSHLNLGLLRSPTPNSFSRLLPYSRSVGFSLVFILAILAIEWIRKIEENKMAFESTSQFIYCCLHTLKTVPLDYKAKLRNKLPRVCGEDRV